MTKSRGIYKPKAVWTPEREKLMRDFYPHVPTEEIVKALGVCKSSIYRKAKDLGLLKTEDFMASDHSGRVKRGQQHPRMVATQFKPGLQPWNKGTHYQAGGRCAETQFKPGQQPHTTMPVGSYRVVTNKTGGKHLEQKTSEAKGANHMRWTPVSRLVWMAANGPVPAGSVVVFRPGMRTLVRDEITLDRVECITRKENAARNHPNRSNPEMAKLIQLKGAITRQVNRIQKESRA